MSCVVREVAWRAPACGAPAVPRASGSRTPLCEAHLCRYGRSASISTSTSSSRRQSVQPQQQRCFAVPRRLVYSVRDSGGLLPDDSESYFCDEHHRFACRATVADGTPCPEERDRRASLSSGGDAEFCRGHARAVCRAKGKGCRSVAMDGADLCEMHRCANGIGGRGPEGHCTNQRTATGQFCEEHVCIWRDAEGRRCSGQSVHAGACCAKHTCVRCEFGAEDGTTRCIYHVCAYGRREGVKSEYPACEEGVEKEGLCSRHRPRTRTREGGRRKKRDKQTVVEFGRDLVEYVGAEEALEEDDTTAEYFSDPDYPPVVQISRAAKTKRSASTRLMKRIEYKGIEMERGGRAQSAWAPPPRPHGVESAWAPPPQPPPPQPQYPQPQYRQPRQLEEWDQRRGREEPRHPPPRPATARPHHQPEPPRSSRHSYQPDETRRHVREPSRPRELPRHRERSTHREITHREVTQHVYRERPQSYQQGAYGQEHYQKEAYQREQYDQQWSVEPWRPWTPRY